MCIFVAFNYLIQKTNVRGVQTYEALGMRESHYLMYEEFIA